MIFKKQEIKNSSKKIVGLHREEIFTYKYDNGTYDRALVRTYYHELKDIVIITPIDSNGFQNILEYFAHIATYFHDLEPQNTIYIEHRPAFLHRSEEFSIFEFDLPKHNNFYNIKYSVNWLKTISKNEVEELIKTEFKYPFIKFNPTLKYHKTIHDLKLFLIPFAMNSIRSVEGRYKIDINPNINNKDKTFIEQNNFVKNLKYIEVNCKNGSYNILKNELEEESEINRVEHFYKIGSNFAKEFDLESFKCYRSYSNVLIITRTEFTKLIANSFKNTIERQKYEYKDVIFDNELMSEISSICDYILCTTLAQPLFNIIENQL